MPRPTSSTPCNWRSRPWSRSTISPPKSFPRAAPLARKETCHPQQRRRSGRTPRSRGPAGLHRRRQPHSIPQGARTTRTLHARSISPCNAAARCLLRQPFAADAFDQVILGCVNVIADEMNPARVAALRLGMGEAMPAFTVQINCGSGMQSIDTAYRYIQQGVCDLVLAGGAESLSHSPLVFRRSAVEWYAALATARAAPLARLKAIAAFRPSMLKPIIGLERGLTDPVVELNMGQTAEVLAHVFDVSRRDADQYAVESQLKLARAQAGGCFAGELEPAFGRNGKVYDLDDGVRPDSSVESLAKLKPAFERPWGKVTPGNSSQISDGASWVILASEAAVKQHGLTPRAVIIDSQWSALDPSIMGLGPVLCSTALLKRREFEPCRCGSVGAQRGFCGAGSGLPGGLGGRCVLPRGAASAGRGRRHRPRQAQRGRRRHRARASGRRQRQPDRSASGQCDEAARAQTRNRHRMHRRRAGRRHVDRDGVGAAMAQRVWKTLEPRNLELGPLSRPGAGQDIGAWRHWKLAARRR